MHNSHYNHELANIVSLMYEKYDWNDELNSFHDKATMKNVPNLLGNVAFAKLKSMPMVNAFKAVLSKNRAFDPRSIVGYEQRFASHFGTFAQAQHRFELMEEDDWHIFRYTINLDNLYPKLLKDKGGYFEEENATGIELARKAGYKVLAYRNVGEGEIEMKDNISLVVLDPNAIL